MRRAAFYALRAIIGLMLIAATLAVIASFSGCVDIPTPAVDCVAHPEQCK